jgi:hypothetical protein
MKERLYYQPATLAETEKRKELLRDQLFRQLVASRVLDEFNDDLGYADFPEETFQEFETAFASLSEEDKRSVLAVPAQLRVPYFRKYAERVQRGEMNGADVVNDMLTIAKRHGYTLGFHLSLYDIKPGTDGSWFVRGTEPDHRHDDIPMAYYSMDYSNRYKQKRVNYMYVVRAETGENTSHYQDNDGSWGHAASLSIISKINLGEMERELEQRLKSAEMGKGGDATDAPPAHASVM